MKKYLLLLCIVSILCGCTAAKSSTIRYAESRVVEKAQKEPEKAKKPYVKKEKIQKAALVNKDIIYKGRNEKAGISYNLSSNILTYKINAGNRRMLIRAGGLAGLIYINDKTYYTNYSTGKIKAKGCIYDSSTKNIVVNPNIACEINMEITVDDMPAVEQIENMGYKSDLGEFTLLKKAE